MGRTALFDRLAVDRVLDQQYGLITRRQAREHGMTDSALYHRIRGLGAWQVVLPGVYLCGTGRPTGPQCETAALLYAGPGSLITGRAALEVHGIRAPKAAGVDLLVSAGCQRRSTGFVRLHRTTRLPETVHRIGPLRYVPAHRAVIDTCRWISEICDVRAIIANAVQRDKVRVGDLARELATGQAVGSALIRDVLAEIADGVRSASEADLRALVKREGLPDPHYNPRLYLNGEFISMPDAWWPEAAVAVEVDSREWHLSPGDWARTMARHSRMSARGIIVLHYPPSRLRAEGAAVAAEIRLAIESGRQRTLPPFRMLTASPGRAARG